MVNSIFINNEFIFKYLSIYCRIGLKEKDFEEFKISNDCFQCLTNEDIKKINELKNNIKNENEDKNNILKELIQMKKNGKKAEIECLSSKSIEFLSSKLFDLKIFQYSNSINLL